jgi:hypothetical protein
MEYVADRGAFADIPFAEIKAVFDRYYPQLGRGRPGGDFAAEAAAETPST